MLTAEQRRFVEARRVAHLATADARGVPHVVPVTFALDGDRLYIAIDEKPKRTKGPPLKRLANIVANPATAVVFDLYDEDWTRLGWVMLRGSAEILADGAEHDRAQALVRARYPQLASMEIARLPVIAIRIERVASWGRLSNDVQSDAPATMPEPSLSAVPSDRPAPAIAIVGAGFSGSLLAVQLLRRFLPQARVYLFEKNAEFGRGLAFATGNPNHLLNVRANRMSAFADEPDHFVRWLQSSPKTQAVRDQQAMRPDMFVPRSLYGTYVQELLGESLWSEGAPTNLYLVPDEAVALTPAERGYVIEVAGGRRYEVDAAVLAIGNILSDDTDGRFFRNPWDPRALEGLDPEAPVVLIGTGLTMIDTVITLLDRGHRGPIRAISRRGLLPRRHGEAPALADLEAPNIAAPRVNELMRMVRRQTNRGGDGTKRWRSVVDALRPFTQDLWLAMPEFDRQRFLRHLRPWWDVHRHRMAPVVADVIEGVLARGQLEVIAGRVRDIEVERYGAMVSVQRRGSVGVERVAADRIIDCSGPICDYDKIDHGLVRDLLARGLVRPDSLRLGLDVTHRSELIDHEGTPSQRLFAIGPVTRGTFWEITSVPDIREQCWQLAALLAERLTS